MNDPLHQALYETLTGLQDIIIKIDPEKDALFEIGGDQTRLANLAWMCQHAILHVESWPVDKTSRWIGFIQGVLAVKEFLDVNEERDRTRPIFHKAYSELGFQIPKTASLES